MSAERLLPIAPDHIDVAGREWPYTYAYDRLDFDNATLERVVHGHGGVSHWLSVPWLPEAKDRYLVAPRKPGWRWVRHNDAWMIEVPEA